MHHRFGWGGKLPRNSIFAPSGRKGSKGWRSDGIRLGIPDKDTQKNRYSYTMSRAACWARWLWAAFILPKFHLRPKIR